MCASLRRVAASLCQPFATAPQGHPDPTGKQLQMLIPTLKAIVKACDSGEEGFPPRFGIVWDFLSLPQRGYTTGYVPDEVDSEGRVVKKNDDRTGAQLERFGKGLANINVLTCCPLPLPWDCACPRHLRACPSLVLVCACPDLVRRQVHSHPGPQHADAKGIGEHDRVLEAGLVRLHMHRIS